MFGPISAQMSPRARQTSAMQPPVAAPIATAAVRCLAMSIGAV
eukprot:COSAG06_NODE_65828_length_256_cov_0.611465_1_plen_42_part_10